MSSETVTPTGEATARTERTVLHRTYAADAQVEGRTVDVRLVPFGEVARVADPPDYTPYDEEWMPGVFDHQLRAPNRIHANYEHMAGPANIVGHGLELRSEADGYHASFEIHETPQGDATLAMLRGGALPAVSLEAHPVRNTRSSGGVIQRVKANLRGMAFTRQGAFEGAQVLAVRADGEEDEVTIDAALLPVEMDPERVERLRAQGIALPDRYTKAHPANTDTPAEAGTSEDGTRQPSEDTTSEE